MKIKYLLFVFMVFSVFLGIALLMDKEKSLKIISSPKVYSMMHTELNETFKISVLMNQNNTYHLDTKYISKSILKDGDNQLPVSVEEIVVSNQQTLVSHEGYYLVSFIVSLNLEMNDHIINYEKAALEITYENQQILDFEIGEFNYAFKENPKDISMYNLHGTFGDVNGINTVTGIAIELYNKCDHNISIQRIDILSEDVSLNNDYLIEKNREIDMFEEVKDVLVTDAYQFDTYESNENHQSILNGQSKQLYIPILYNDEIKYISRFVIMVTYKVDGMIETLYIDDFVFMNSIHYGLEYEENYKYYEFTDQ